jgi:tetratricopeptide (TPR) repeat protein
MVDFVAGRSEALRQAVAALNAQRPIEAEQLASAVLKADPRQMQALRVIGYALLMQGRTQDAVAALTPAARGSRDPELETQLAIALRQAGRPEDAESQLKRAIKRRPPFAAAFHEFGCLLASMKRHDEAIETFRRGLEVAPMMPELSIELGYALLRRGYFAEANRVFAKAADIAPNSYDVLFGLAMARQESGEYQSAAEYFRRCLTLKPNDTSALLNLGNCLLELGQNDDGYECFRAAARGDAKRYGLALGSLVKVARGRFWLKPSEAAAFLGGKKV